MQNQGVNLLDEYQGHADVLEKKIASVDQMIAALNDISKKISEK
jgi:hypothetical protein